MIEKLISQLSTDVLEFFNKYNIQLTAQYTPDLPGIISYSRNFLTRTLVHNPTSVDGKLYQNKLLYKVDTPKPAEFSPQNNPLSVLSGMENIGQDYIIETTSNTISKIRTSTDDATVKVRDVTIMQIPVDFTIITESLDLVFAVSTLFYQQLVLQNILTVELDLFSNGVKHELPYFMNWDRDSLEISYANFENMSALNTLSFKVVLSGAVFSEFYTEDHVIDKYEITVGTIRT